MIPETCAGFLKSIYHLGVCKIGSDWSPPNAGGKNEERKCRAKPKGDAAYAEST